MMNLRQNASEHLGESVLELNENFTKWDFFFYEPQNIRELVKEQSTEQCMKAAEGLENRQYMGLD